MVARLLHRRISRVAACLAALMLTLPAPLPPACGCSLANLSGKDSERTRAEKPSSARKACCDSHGPTINSQPCCCSSVPPGRTSAQCKCGPSCACSQDQVPDPPAGPVNQRSATPEQESAAQATVSATSLPAPADAVGSKADRVRDCIGRPATSLERCILLSCFTL